MFDTIVSSVDDVPVDPGLLEKTRNLFDKPLDELLDQAGTVARTRSQERGLAHLGASPIILTGSCATQPPCRHCKWEHFKTEGRGPFVLDTAPEQLIDRAHTLVASGIRRAFTATGWLGYSLPHRFIERVALIHEAEPQLELFGLFGALDQDSLLALADAGLSGMLTGLESPSESVYASFRPGGDKLVDRLNSFVYTRRAGLDLWSGFLVGLGETADDCALGIELLRAYEPSSVSILPFEPYPDTPMADHPPCDPTWLARVNAVARIALPQVDRFFHDHNPTFAHTYRDRLGMNGSYETGR